MAEALIDCGAEMMGGGGRCRSDPLLPEFGWPNLFFGTRDEEKLMMEYEIDYHTIM